MQFAKIFNKEPEYNEQDVKEVLGFAISVGEALADGIGIEDLSVLLEAPAALEGVENVWFTFNQMGDAARNNLLAFVKEELDLPDDRVEEFVEACFEWFLVTFRLYKKFKSLRDEPIPDDPEG